MAKTEAAGTRTRIPFDQTGTGGDWVDAYWRKGYVQTGLAIDRHWAGNGAMKILPDSHRMGHPEMDEFSPADHRQTAEEAWTNAGISLDGLIDLEMGPGDVALWTPFTVHGGGINTTTDSSRRLYINGYVIAENCDRGEWVFRDGKPVALNLQNPALIQFDAIHDRPEAFYPDREDRTAIMRD